MAYCHTKTTKCRKTSNILRKTSKYFPVALTIAGSDSGGGAGIQADIRTFSALAVFGTSAITALTAQNPFELKAIMPVTRSFLLSQLDAVFAKFAIGAVKTGMLCNSTLIEAVYDFFSEKKKPYMIVDPVMVATSGAILLESDAILAMKEKIFPLADCIMPNIKEAELILGISIKNLNDAISAAREISEKWNCVSVLKGGHLIYEKGRRTDVLVCEDGNFLFSTPDLDVSGYASHGTGCTFSAALAANFAKGLPSMDALRDARAFVYSSLLEKVSLGRNIKAMFPPKKNYINEVEICEIH